MNLLTGFTRLLGTVTDFGIGIDQARQRTAPAMQLDDDLLLSDDLPPEARRIIGEAEAAVADVRRQSERAVAAVRDQADREVAAIRARADTDAAAAQRDAAGQLSPLLRDLFGRLKAVQAECLRTGDLDGALAVRSRLRSLRGDLFGVRPDPGNLTDYGSADVGKVMLFEIVGEDDSDHCWGTDVYTGDSRLSVAAVHAGAVRPAERALVRVALFDGSERLFEGTERYGVRSRDYGNYTVAYTVERV